MADSVSVPVGATTMFNGGTLKLLPDSGSSTVRADRLPRQMPASIRRSQQYFWSVEWQAGERAADADFAAGRSRVFGDPSDAVRWLLSAEG